MAINIGRGTIRAGEDRRMHADPDPYYDGDRVLIAFKQLSGPGALGVLVQMAPGLTSSPKGDDGWDTIADLRTFEDADVQSDGGVVVLEVPGPGKRPGAHLRAIVTDGERYDQERTYRLNVSPGK